jgi:hypothetical protein
MIKNVHHDLHGKIAEIKQIKEPKDCLSGLYEEISSNWNKLYKACDENNVELAFITGVYLPIYLKSDIFKQDKSGNFIFI